MRNMKKIVAWMLGLIMLLGIGTAAANTLPAIPAFVSTLNVRQITTAEEAAEYAKEIWALDFLGEDTNLIRYLLAADILRFLIELLDLGLQLVQIVQDYLTVKNAAYSRICSESDIF